VKKVDGNIVYRLGSVTNVFTVLAFLAEAGDIDWNQPITKYIPELAKLDDRSDSNDFDSVGETDWDDITIGALASQVSGLGRDCKSLRPHCVTTSDKVLDGTLGEISQTDDLPADWQAGFAPLANTSKPPCGAWPLCTRERE
jgi:CubicO group peptidase (beta-lactamase class C family)